MKKRNNIYRLVYHSPKFYSHLDQDMFFEWCKRIKCIDSTINESGEVLIFLEKKSLSAKNLLELIFLFRRYEIQMMQLRPYVTEKNSAWLKQNKQAYWYEPLFGVINDVN